MKFFQAKSFEGLIIKTAIFTLILHVLFTPIVDASGIFFLQKRGEYDGCILRIQSVLVVLSIPWGLCFRKANAKLFSSDLAKKEKYAKAMFIVLPVLGVLTLIPGSMQVSIFLNTVTNYIENHVIKAFLYQACSPLTILGCLVSLATVFFFKFDKRLPR